MINLPTGRQTVLVQDDRTRTADEFRLNCRKVAAYIDANTARGEVVSVVGDNRLESLELVVGVVMAGRHAVGLPIFLKDKLSDIVRGETGSTFEIGLGTGVLDPSGRYLDGLTDEYESERNGMIATISSGSTGRPKISAIDPMRTDGMADLTFEKLGVERGASILYPAPVLTVSVVFLMSIMQGLKVVTTNEKMSTSVLESLLSENCCEAMYARPSLIERLERDGFSPNKELKSVLSSSSKLDRRHIDYINSLGLAACDVYSSTETGPIGILRYPEDVFTPFNHVSLRNEGNTTVCQSDVAIGSWIDGALCEHGGFVVLDDILELTSKGVRFLSRDQSKLRVHGFTVMSSVIIDSLMEIPGITACDLVIEDGELVAYVEGEYNGEEIVNALGYKLPFYSVPSRLITGRKEAGREQYSLPQIDR